jgi:hypothetical protein
MLIAKSHTDAIHMFMEKKNPIVKIGALLFLVLKGINANQMPHVRHHIVQKYDKKYSFIIHKYPSHLFSPIKYNFIV